MKSRELTVNSNKIRLLQTRLIFVAKKQQQHKQIAVAVTNRIICKSLKQTIIVFKHAYAQQSKHPDRAGCGNAILCIEFDQQSRRRRPFSPMHNTCVLWVWQSIFVLLMGLNCVCMGARSRRRNAVCALSVCIAIAAIAAHTTLPLDFVHSVSVPFVCLAFGFGQTSTHDLSRTFHLFLPLQPN